MKRGQRAAAAGLGAAGEPRGRWRGGRRPGRQCRYLVSAGLTGGEAPPVNLGAPVSSGAQAADAGGGDSSHSVEVKFVNAPPGMRSGLVSAQGDARLSLRTSYAMGATF
jgi:hypothetical protein